jgi:hypothetical protein
MSQENVEFLEALLTGASEMDKQALLDGLPELIAQACDPEIEWVEDPRRAAQARLSRARGRARVLGALA